jgi:hypothetical protein
MYDNMNTMSLQQVIILAPCVFVNKLKDIPTDEKD